MIRVGVLGASGYAGAELIRLILQRDDLQLVFADSKEFGGRKLADLYPNFTSLSQASFSSMDIEDNEYFDQIDVLFCSLPHGLTQRTVQAALKRKDLKVIDLSADFRLDNKEVYEAWYETNHEAEGLLEEAVYGLSELNRDRISQARLVANPGCYPTSIILALYPLFKEGYTPNLVLADSKSGVSGSGRGLKDANLYCQASESTRAYSLGRHRHQPEIHQELAKFSGKDFDLVFTPHLVPMNRGILSTIYVENVGGLSREDLVDLYQAYYKDEYFIRVLADGLPDTKAVAGSNFVDIGFGLDEASGYIILVSAIDNLIKGASGQAMQNMNIIFAIDERKGLSQLPLWP